MMSPVLTKRTLVVIVTFYTLIGILLFLGSSEPREKAVITGSLSPPIDKECERLVSAQFEDARARVQNNTLALEIVKKECLQVMPATLIADFDGDGQKEIAMITAGAGCRSCHAQELRIIKDNEVIFEKEGNDLEIEPANNFTGFLLKEPILENSEPACCHAESIVEGYMPNRDSYYKVSKEIVPGLNEPVGANLIGTKIVWDGIVVSNMTYGRIRAEKLPRDDKLPYFIVEEYDARILWQDHGTKVRVWGEVTSIDGCDVYEGCKRGQLIPWILVEKMENI